MESPSLNVPRITSMPALARSECKAHDQLGLLPIQCLLNAPERVRQGVGRPGRLEVVAAQDVEHLAMSSSADARERERLADAHVERVELVGVDLRRRQRGQAVATSRHALTGASSVSLSPRLNADRVVPGT